MGAHGHSDMGEFASSAGKDMSRSMVELGEQRVQTGRTMGGLERKPKEDGDSIAQSWDTEHRGA